MLISSRPEQIPSNDVAISSDGFRGAFIAWIQGTRVFSQRVDSSGHILWTPGGVVLCDDAADRGAVAISSSSAGAIVSWGDTRQPPGVYAQRVAPTGEPKWQTNGAFVGSLGGGGARRNISDTKGGAFIGHGLKIQHVDSLGSKHWDTTGVPFTTYPATNSVMVLDQRDGVINVTEAMVVAGSNLDILAQRIDSSGAPRWQFNGVHLVDDSTLQEFPSAVSDGRGGAIAVWDDQRSFIDPNTPDHVAVFAQRVSAEGTITSATEWDDDESSPKTPRLEQNYPNPFNPETTIKFSLPNAGHARLTIYDLLGRSVRILFDQVYNRGEYQTTWDVKSDQGIHSATGMYIYQLEFERITIAKKLILLH